MRIFFDTEFTGLHQNTTLISLGVVSDYGQAFYAEFTDYDVTQLDTWLEENVIANLGTSTIDKLGLDLVYVKGTREEIAQGFLDWLKNIYDGSPIEVWSDCLAYDWMLLNELWGGALNKPEMIYYIPFDLCTLLLTKEIDPDTNRESLMTKKVKGVKHNALWDAYVIRNIVQRFV